MNKDKISLGAMSAYEKITGRNALKTLQIDENMSATDLIGMLFMASYTKDNTTTIERIESLDQDQISKLMAELTNAVTEQKTA